MPKPRILGIVLLICSLIAYSVSKKHHEQANSYESDARTASPQQAEMFAEFAADHQTKSKQWGVASILGFIGAAVLIAAPTYLRRRNEPQPARAAIAPADATPLEVPRLTGPARRGALTTLAGAIFGLIATDLPGRTLVNEFGARIKIPVRECSFNETLLLIAGLAAAILAAWLTLGQTTKPRRPIAYALIALAAFLTLNAVYTFIHIPAYYVAAETFNLAPGAWLNALAAAITTAGAILALRALPSPSLEGTGATEHSRL